MKTDYLTREELVGMQKEKGKICISIIVPTHRLSPERRADPVEVERMVNKAKEYLQYKYEKDEIKPLIESLDQLYGQIDFDHNAEGIGLFVSPNFKQQVQFFFPVEEKVIITDSFEIRDLLYQDYYLQPYLVLLLTEKEAKLYKGKLNALEEINDVHFPMKHEDDYEYNRPSRGSSYVGNAFTKEFERDKSQLEEMRYEDFLQQADEVLNTYVTDNTCLIVAGANKDVSYFNNITKHKNIAGEMHGNYTYMPLKELAALTWEAMRAFLDEAKQKLVREFEEKIGQRHGIAGITDIWKAVKEGRGLKLLVEKDFRLSGFLIKNDDYNLYLHPVREDYTILPDAVNTLIETALEKDEEVTLVANGALAAHQHIALITRY
ncbi:hypothetical protein [Segetibacter koreensis]|uniref:baeRF3 domain-containing protein n=1 Tax=Segetibacter koreensis TaxID=398037 RepID=UPI0003819DD8|nr:hypothetical protein [Segetibacter koreensis]